MKNIHLLPTYKPSRLYEFGGELILTNEPASAFRNQHIYITSDEEIKEGDWFIQVNTSKRIKHHSKNGLLLQPQSFDKKIILTTDQDLDGVQAIDDDFLEWFVKNPSCEEVEVIKEYKDGFRNCYKYQDDFFSDHFKPFAIRYRIIIPKEEPKQETLEEAAKKVYGSDASKDVEYYAFILGAKWQQERMYSEAIEFAEWIRNNPYVWNYPDKLNDTRTTEELFEQFKKK